VTVVPRVRRPDLRIRPVQTTDRPWAEALVSEHFASPRLVSRGVLYEAGELPGLVAEQDERRVGLLLHRIEGDRCEVVALIAVCPRQGIGRSLLAAIEPIARAAGCVRLWLVTTNDNRPALAFYRALGWRQAAVHRGALRRSRLLKPEIPTHALDGTPIEDEIELERGLGVPPAVGRMITREESGSC